MAEAKPCAARNRVASSASSADISPYNGSVKDHDDPVTHALDL